MKIMSECMVDANDKYIFTSMELNLIFSMDKKNKQIQIIGKVPTEMDFGRRLFGDIVRWNDNFIFIPLNAKSIWIADNTLIDWTEIKLEKSEMKLKFLRGYVINDNLILLRHQYMESLNINLKTKKISKLDINPEDFFTYAEMLNDRLLFASCNSDRCYSIDIRDFSVSKFCNLKNSNFNALLKSGDELFFSPRYGKSITIYENGEVHEIQLEHDISGLEMFEHMGKIIFPTIEEGRTFYVDLKTEQVRKLDNNITFVYSKKLSLDTHCLIDSDANFYLFNKKCKDPNIYNLDIDFNSGDALENFDMCCVINEGYLYGLRQFLHGIINYY